MVERGRCGVCWHNAQRDSHCICARLVKRTPRRDIRVLVYAGDQDYICNWLGNQVADGAESIPRRAD